VTKTAISIATKIPTSEEFLVKYKDNPRMLDLIVKAAISIKYNYKKLLREIKKDNKKYEEVYEALNDSDVIDLLKKCPVFDGRTEEEINKDIRFIKMLIRPNEADRILWVIGWFERKILIPGLPKKEAVKFVLNLKYEDINRVFQNKPTTSSEYAVVLTGEGA